MKRLIHRQNYLIENIVCYIKIHRYGVKLITMKTKLKKLTAALLALCIAVSMTACGRTDSGSADNDGGAGDFNISVDYSAPDLSADSIPDPVIKENGDKLTVVDSIGREVELPAEPERIAVLDSFAGEAAVMTGAGEQMVTCPNGVKSDSLLRQMAPSLKDMEAVMSAGSFNAEALLALSPDVIMIKEGLYSSEEERGKLEKLQIPYIVVGYDNMAEQIYALKLVGAAEGSECRARAQEMAEYYCSVIKRVSADAAKIPEDKVKRVYHSINEAVRTDGEDSLGNDWISCVGAADVSAAHTDAMQADGVDFCAGLEQIFAWDPDVMICNEASTKDYLLTDSKWTGLRAVREKSVYNIPVGATRWGQRGSLETFFAMIWLGKTIYPEYYSDFDLKSEVTQFYSDMLGIDVDDELYEMMLSGTGIRNASQNGGA